MRVQVQVQVQVQAQAQAQAQVGLWAHLAPDKNQTSFRSASGRRPPVADVFLEHSRRLAGAVAARCRLQAAGSTVPLQLPRPMRRAPGFSPQALSVKVSPSCRKVRVSPFGNVSGALPPPLNSSSEPA